MKKTERMANNGLRDSFRRPYIKPRLEQVELVPEEAVLQSCKSGWALINCFCSQICCTPLIQCHTQGT